MDSPEPATKKSKTIHDFFQAPTLAPILHPSTPSKAFSTTPTSVPGVSLLPSFITPSEEADILNFLSVQPWRTDLARRTMHYGGTYCLMPPRDSSPATRKSIEHNIIAAPAVPPPLAFLIDRMVQYGLYLQDQRPRYIIVNEYLPTHGISAHVENFRFISPVCGLTLGDGDYLRFHELVEADDGSVRTGKAAKAKRTGRKCDVWMPPRSLLVMSGEGRWKWQHEIVRGRKKELGWKRTSLTFRSEDKGREGRKRSRQ